MTKTLTEQWRDGTLPEGCYYVEFYTEKTPYIEICGSQYLGYLAEFSGTDRAEVLAPVPSYNEYNDLIQQNVNQESAIETYIEQIKELEEENKNLKEQIHSMLFTDDVVQERYDKSMQKMHILEKRLEVSEKEHYKTLEQLRIATKALEYYDRLENIIIDWKLLTGQDAGTARKALKEMEGVK